MITITDTAQEKIRTIIEGRKPDVKGLRVGYEGKNRYNMSLVDELPDDGEDLILPYNGFEVVIDRDSVARMEGTTIDYLETPVESGFKIDNPADNIPTASRPEGPPEEGPDRDLYERIQLLI
ncbi:MAG: iron-sulfur cluster assembly accessory protein, partial [Armatimonadota bacterium]|nr:iron-sulfur cluster assembly accessory protein [Armatimonadota bacterium]